MADVLPPPLSPENVLLVGQEAQMEAKDCMDESETTGSSSTTVMGASSLLGKTKVAAKAISSGKRKLEKTQQQNEWINEKMNALHDLIPNSSKVDEVSMLDDVIQYIKLLQCQHRIMCSFGSSGMMGMPSPLMVSLSNQASFPPRKLNICVGIPSCYPLGTVYGVSPRTMSYVPTTTYGWENIQKYECNEGLQDEESNSMLNLGDHIENLEGKNKKKKIGQQRNHHRCSIK